MATRPAQESRVQPPDRTRVLRRSSELQGPSRLALAGRGSAYRPVAHRPRSQAAVVSPAAQTPLTWWSIPVLGRRAHSRGACSATMYHHRSGSLRQTNKGHKRGQHDSKRATDRRTHGRVDKASMTRHGKARRSIKSLARCVQVWQPLHIRAAGCTGGACCHRPRAHPCPAGFRGYMCLPCRRWELLRLLVLVGGYCATA